jgi:hypothetical protein
MLDFIFTLTYNTELSMVFSSRRSAFIRFIALTAASLSLISCGGGDGGETPTALSVTPTSLSYTPPTTAPRTQSKPLTANFAGDFVVVGYAPGVTPPTWIGTVTNGPATGTAGARSVTFTIPVNATGLAAGTYSVTIRVLTGKGTAAANATALNFVEVPITMTVN